MYKTEGWKDIKAGDKVEVLHHRYTNIAFPEQTVVTQVCWVGHNAICVGVLDSKGSDWSLVLGKDEQSQVRVLKDNIVKPEVDWSKAPEGATDFNTVNGWWYKEGQDKLMSFWRNDSQFWAEGGNREEYAGCLLPIEKSTTQGTKKPEWKIKHIKSPNYTPKKDGAITILYKELEGGYVKYKVAFLNPKDMFDRKLGVANAKGKKSRKIYVDKGTTTKEIIGKILIHTSLSEYLSKDSKIVSRYWLNNTFEAIVP